MKRFVAIVLTLVVAFAVVGCSSDTESKKEEPTYDKKAYRISDGVLERYSGEDSEITLPEAVKEIGENALSGDMGYAENLRKVTVPGTVEKVCSHGFAFTEAEYIYFEEGLKVIEKDAFNDSFIDDVWIPSSVEKIENYIFNGEEPCGTTVHIVKGSYADEYFSEWDEEVEVVYDYK